jgi:hypothetical protein
MKVSTCTLSSLFSVAALLGVIYPLSVTGDLILNENLMQLSKTAAELSILGAYQENPPSDAYDTFDFFDAEPDQALVAKTLGYCFVAFRGTTLTVEDWRQNLRPGTKDVCMGPEGDETCCSTRTGFYQAYNAVYKNEVEAAVRACAKDCLNPDECVVLTGHSQGGAIAAVAALYLADLNPYVITFGQPRTVNQPCDLITSERYYRYVNSKDSVAGRMSGISYDPVPFSPGSGMDSFGHMILLSSDSTSVAYIGLDAQDFFGPLDVLAQAHLMVGGDDAPPGYLDRIKAIIQEYSENRSYPVSTSGYVLGSLCSEGKECASDTCEMDTTFAYSRCVGLECEENNDCNIGHCDSGLCLPKLGSCMACNEDSDCAGEECVLFRCSGETGKMDDNCRCLGNSDCNSGRCEGLFPPVCKAKLGGNSRCSEDSDCQSNRCSWQFRCKD